MKSRIFDIDTRSAPDNDLDALLRPDQNLGYERPTASRREDDEGRHGASDGNGHSAGSHQRRDREPSTPARSSSSSQQVPFEGFSIYRHRGKH